MSFIINQEESHELSPDFIEVAEKLSELQTSYTASKESALITRMEIIGLAEEQKAKYPQRSPEHRFINAGYEANEWGSNTISMNLASYKLKQKLLRNVNQIFNDLAEICTQRQLYELSRCEGFSTAYHAAQYLKRNGKVPSVKAIKGHAAGHFTDKFVSKASLAAQRRSDEPSLHTCENSTSQPSQSYATQSPVMPAEAVSMELSVDNITAVVEAPDVERPVINVTPQPESSQEETLSTDIVDEIGQELNYLIERLHQLRIKEQLGKRPEYERQLRFLDYAAGLLSGRVKDRR